jgi:hypothetical protein
MESASNFLTSPPAPLFYAPRAVDYGSCKGDSMGALLATFMALSPFIYILWKEGIFSGDDKKTMYGDDKDKSFMDRIITYIKSHPATMVGFLIMGWAVYGNAYHCQYGMAGLWAFFMFACASMYMVYLGITTLYTTSQGLLPVEPNAYGVWIAYVFAPALCAWLHKKYVLH